MSSIEWCERYVNQQLYHNRWFDEPINTISNVSYLVSVYKTRNMGHNLLSLYSSLLMVSHMLWKYMFSWFRYTHMSIIR